LLIDAARCAAVLCRAPRGVLGVGFWLAASGVVFRARSPFSAHQSQFPIRHLFSWGYVLFLHV
jgi:hypothetical protein